MTEPKQGRRGPSTVLKWLCTLLVYLLSAALAVELAAGIRLFSEADFLNELSGYDTGFHRQVHYGAYNILHLLETQGKQRFFSDNYLLNQNLSYYQQLLSPSSTLLRYRVVDNASGRVLATNLEGQTLEEYSRMRPCNAVYFTDGLWDYRYWASNNNVDCVYGSARYVQDNLGEAIDLAYVTAALYEQIQPETPAEDPGAVYSIKVEPYGTLTGCQKLGQDYLLTFVSAGAQTSVYVSFFTGEATVNSVSEFETSTNLIPLDEVLSRLDPVLLYNQKDDTYALSEDASASLSPGGAEWKSCDFRIEYFYPTEDAGPDFLSDSVMGDYLSRRLEAQRRFRIVLYAFGITAAVFLIAFLYLICTVGYRRGVDGVYLAFWNRIPYDIFCLALAGGGMLLLSVLYHKVDDWITAGLFLAALIWIGLFWLFSTVARARAHGLFFNTVVGACWRLLMHILESINLVWVLWAAFGLYFVFSFLLAVSIGSGFGLMLSWAVGLMLMVGITLWMGDFERLRLGIHRLAQGDADSAVSPLFPFSELQQACSDLNSSQEGMKKAVENQMRSERMKTELITNVSHDLKTPLTSIVNYVDLLQRAETETQRQECLAVLSRQSARMKKLILDLVEASKASTGSISLTLQPVNSQELVHQALAEYSDRLEAAGLTVVTRMPTAPVYVMADGQQLWRVFDNLFGNACKYSLPGSRIYLNADPESERLRFTLKNISRAELNISADELMERFVRGDSSRHTEGSGLGLNITRSLLELQQGTFDLTVDGDLFKAEFTLPLTDANGGPPPAQSAADGDPLAMTLLEGEMPLREN